MIDEKAATLEGFPDELIKALNHMILAHHGEPDFGSPLRPATAEAVALHLIDNLDAKINHLYCHLGGCDPSDTWSSYDKYLKTQIYQRRWYGLCQGDMRWNIGMTMN